MTRVLAKRPIIKPAINIKIPFFIRADQYVPKEHKENSIAYLIDAVNTIVKDKSVVLHGAYKEEMKSTYDIHCICNKRTDWPHHIVFMRMHRLGKKIWPPDVKALTGIVAMHILVKTELRKLLISGWNFYLFDKKNPTKWSCAHPLDKNITVFKQMAEDPRVHLTPMVKESVAIYSEYFKI